jgi:hypothetical protein
LIGPVNVDTFHPRNGNLTTHDMDTYFYGCFKVPLLNIVPRQVVVVDNESPIVVTLNSSATELLGISPKHLSLVSTHLTSNKRIRRESYRCHRILISHLFENNSTIYITRVLHSIDFHVFICIVLCESLHGTIPYERANTYKPKIEMV